jgi:heptosyltransferase-2
MRILVAQTTYLGDLVLTLPLLQHLRSAFHAATIDMLVEKGVGDVVRGSPVVDGVISFDRKGRERGIRGLFQLASRIEEKRYDVALVLPGSLRTAMAVYLSGIPRRIGTNQGTGLLLHTGNVTHKREVFNSPPGRAVVRMEMFAHWLTGNGSFVTPLFTDIVRLNPQYHAGLRHLQLLEPLGIQAKQSLFVPQLAPLQADIRTVESLMEPLAPRPVVAIAPGSTWPTKRWGTAHFAELVDVLVSTGAAVVLVGGGEDRTVAEEIGQERNGILNLCGKLTPLQSSEVLARCRVLVSNDSAPVHLASARGLPCIVLYGPTAPTLGFAPLGNHHVLIENKQLGCRPCTPHGGVRCPIGTHECMTSIGVAEVLQQVQRFLPDV